MSISNKIINVEQSVDTQKPKVNNEVYAYLKSLSMCAQFSDEHLKTLAMSCRFANSESGEYITIEGDEDVSGFIVVSGRFSMIKTSLSGKEFVVEILLPDDIFALMIGLQKLPAQLSARAQMASKILWVQWQAFYE